MTKVYSLKGAALLLFAALAAACSVAAYLVANARADGRTLDGSFCSSATNPFCIEVDSDQGTAMGTMGGHGGELAIRPGTYWLTVDDNSTRHDFVLRSCPGEAVLCDQSQSTGAAPGGNEQALTTIQGEGTVTLKLNLKHGSYRLYCNAPVTGAAAGVTHESMGMYVDLMVGGVGQVDTSQMS
jgi:hypothetical protein